MNNIRNNNLAFVKFYYYLLNSTILILKSYGFWFLLGLIHLNQFVLRRDLDQISFGEVCTIFLILLFCTSKGSYLTNILPVEEVPINVQMYTSKSFNIVSPMRNAVFLLFLLLHAFLLLLPVSGIVLLSIVTSILF